MREGPKVATPPRSGQTSVIPAGIRFPRGYLVAIIPRLVALGRFQYGLLHPGHRFGSLAILGIHL